MLDTIKFGIPLSKHQHKKLSKLVYQNEDWQWVMLNQKTGDLRFVRLKGLFKCDQQSFRREIFWDISETYVENETFLTIELSLPKYWYGHNIHLLFGWYEVIQEIKKQFEKQLNCRFSKIDDWKLWRVDICYAWRCPSQQAAKSLLDSIKKLDYPRKKPIIYGDSIMFTGRTYSLKFYLKLPEFIEHDRKALLKDNARLEWINYLEKKADSVIRCEATLRRQWLKKNCLDTIADLTKNKQYIYFDDEIKENYLDIDEDLGIQLCVASSIVNYMNVSCRFGANTEKIFLRSSLLDDNNGSYRFYAPEHDYEVNGVKQHFKGGGFNVITKPVTVEILSNLITKLIGDYKGMNNIDTVEEKILKKYKNCRAVKLIGFWLFVQRKGIKAAKELYGHDSFYRCRSDLKKAGVGLVTPPKLINASERFQKEFEFILPSEYGTNKFDDFRDSDNLLNFPLQNNQ